MTSLNEALLDEKLTELEQLRSWSPRLMSKFESFLRHDDPWALYRVNPFYFAEDRCSEDEAVDLFLYATKVGLFQMTWSLLCPQCAAAIQSFSSLKSLCSAFHCALCKMDVETQLDDFVHVGFTISPMVRTIPAHDPSTLSVEDYYYRMHFTSEGRLGPGGPRVAAELFPQMAKALSYLEPRQVTSFEVELEPGEAVAHDSITGAVFVFSVDPSQPGPNPTLSLKLSEGKVGALRTSVAPGKLLLNVENDSDARSALLMILKPQEVLDQIAAMAHAGESTYLAFDKFLSGKRLVVSSSFRKLFGDETIRGSEGMGVRDVSILFTDLKSSTAMYDRVGDLKAFALVNQHFERLGRAVARYRGAIVKTIGDAVMASFESPVDAMLAAREMLREIDAFNREVGEREIMLKVGIHRGASIAVTLNDRLDFFGQTVNIAARVQGLADADEIYVTDEVYTAPGVKELLQEFQVTPREAASLRGVQRAVDVYRVTAAP